MKFTDSLHQKFRHEVQVARRRTLFDRKQKAFFRFAEGGRKCYLRGVHRTVEKAFGSLHELIMQTGGGAANRSRSKTATSRGSRIGQELCRWVKKGPSEPLPQKAHGWCKLVVAALERWGIYLIDGEVPVSRGHIATGVDLLGVKYNEKELVWQLVCMELKSGYRGPAWKKVVGRTKKEYEDTVEKSIRNYALTQLQLTHMCAQASLSVYDFARPLLIQVNDDGVTKCSPTPAIRSLCSQLVRAKQSKES